MPLVCTCLKPVGSFLFSLNFTASLLSSFLCPCVLTHLLEALCVLRPDGDYFRCLRLTFAVDLQGNQVKRNVEWVVNTNELPLQLQPEPSEEKEKKKDEREGKEVGATTRLVKMKMCRKSCVVGDMAAAKLPYGSITINLHAKVTNVFKDTC